ncbi:MAG: glutamate formimidoyltransferase [Chitinophagales bacterium]
MQFFKDSDQLVECIPNFSEGRDKNVIKKIVEAIQSVSDTKILHVDMGFDANRTVITFVSKSATIVEAAYQAIKAAAENIDMSIQQGEHPRMGATDVCPLVPLHNISMESTIDLSKSLAKRVGSELKIPVYLYERSATTFERSNLAYLRKGEYESIPKKIKDKNWQPDYGPFTFNKKSGMTAIGARNFLIAYNINLKTTDVTIAKKIAAQIRESGSIKNGMRQPGKFKGLKAIGWMMASYNYAQVSTNIVDINSAPIHEVFETVKSLAKLYGTSVNGSELIGLIPQQILVNAGQFYSSTMFHKGHIEKLIDLSINNLGLDYSSNFISSERIIEKLL